MNFLKYFNENDFKIIYEKNNLDVINFEEIILLSENKIVLKVKNELIITGDNLKVLKLMDGEILIKGLIRKIEIG